MPAALWRVIPAAPWLLLVLQLLGFEGSQRLGGAGGRRSPEALAVLVEESQLGAGEQLQQVLVARRWGSRQRGRGQLALQQDGVHGAGGQDTQLHLGHRVLEVVLGGGAGVEAAVGELQGPQQQALLCPQCPAALCAQLRGQRGSAGCRPAGPRAQHPAPTSFRRSLLSFCSSHLTVACGERGWHSRKAVLPSTPYCTASTVFLLAAGAGHGSQHTCSSPGPISLPNMLLCPMQLKHPDVFFLVLNVSIHPPMLILL